MKYAMTLKWNGTVCLEGTVTATMAWDILRTFSGNFQNQIRAGWIQPSLQELIEATTGTVFACYAFDPKVNGEGQYLLVSLGEDVEPKPVPRLSEAEARRMVAAYRAAHPHLSELWAALEAGAASLED